MGGDDATIPETPSAASGRRHAVQLPSRYRVKEVIGEGGMGRVYRAHDLTLGRDVAIKVIEADLPGPDKTLQRERFVREARAAARLVHPNIVAMHDVDPEAGWLVMELVEGESLRDVAQRGPMPAPLVRKIAEQVLSGLAAAHAAGVIHRDIKPSNIIIGADEQVTIVDFGVARLTDAEITRTGDHLGTPAYMAPEQMRGASVDARTDLYGLGATLYELVTGSRMIAFESPSATALARVHEACGKEHGLARLIVRCLQAEPDARFASANVALATLADTRPPRRRTRLLLLALAVVLVAGGWAAVVWFTRAPAPPDPRLAQAFTFAQRGENERASGILEDYLGEHPNDPDALTYKFLTDWWQGGTVKDTSRLLGARLRPAQRALVHGVDLICARRETEAAAYLERAATEHPNSPEILFALGEALWHGQRLAEGVDALEKAFMLDPRWQMALHHVVEWRLTRGEAQRLVPVADKLRTNDPSAAAALDCKIAIGDRRPAEAVASAKAALARVEPIAELYVCLSQAQALLGDLDAGMATAKQAFDLWPIDLREWGGFAQYAEYFLYRGQLDEYLELLRNKPSRQRALAFIYWRPTVEIAETAPSGPGMRMPPLGAATFVLASWTKHKDELAIYGAYPEPEVRAYGKALWAETRGETAVAIAGYREALAAPAKGDMRMLIAHGLARVLDRTGDQAGAAEACREVLAPRMYQPYRAILLPDCLLWSGDRASWQRLVDTWTSELAHPAVIEARRRLAVP